MANSFGAGFAQGFTSTFNALEAAEARKKADERAEKQLRFQEEESDRRRREFERLEKERTALRTALSEAPTGDQIQVPTFEGMTGGYDQQDAPMRTEAITPDQRRVNLRQRALALGADPEAVQRFEAGDIQMEAGRLGIRKGEQDIKVGEQNLRKNRLEIDRLERTEELNKQFRQISQDVQKQFGARMVELEQIGQTDGLRGIFKRYQSELKKALPGMDVQLIGNNIVVKQGKEVIETISTVKQAVTALKGLLEADYPRALEQALIKANVFSSPKEQLDYFASLRKERREEAESASKITLQGAQTNKENAAAGYYNRGGASANRQTAGAAIRERIGAYAEVLQAADPTLTPEEAKKRAAQVILRDPEARPDVTSADVINFLEKMQGTVIRPDPNTGKPVTLAQLPIEEQIQIARSALSRGSPAGRGGTALPGGLPDANPSQMTRPGAPAPAADPAARPQSALPLTDRLSAAISADNQAGNRNQFRTIAEEVARELPQVESAITVLTQALPRARTESERANLQAKIDELKAKLPMMRSILEQRRAQGL